MEFEVGVGLFDSQDHSLNNKFTIEDFKAEVKDLQGEDIDVAFFPVDPRMGMLFDAGANYFMLTAKPRLLLPMHFWGRGEVINEFARRVKAGETLTEEELAERAALRTEYIREFRASMTGILDNTVIVRPDGTKEKIKPKQ